jgi:CDGSH-type Zn-finger protein
MEDTDGSVEFRVIPNGPLHTKGKFTLIDYRGKTIEITEEKDFCRCGMSKTKPFCDNSHGKKPDGQE